MFTTIYMSNQAHRTSLQMIETLSIILSEFDDLVDKYQVEKIKSFGAIYMYVNFR